MGSFGPPFEFFIMLAIILIILGMVITLILICFCRYCICCCCRRNNEGAVLITRTTIIPASINVTQGATQYAVPAHSGGNVVVQPYPQSASGNLQYNTYQFNNAPYASAPPPDGYPYPSQTQIVNPPSYVSAVK